MKASQELTAAQRIRRDTRQAVRKALLEAGLAEIIARGGLEDPPVEAICARAGYTRGAFYVHFRDREHYDAEIFEWVLTDILSSLWSNTFGETTDIHAIVHRFNRTMADRDWPDLHGDIRSGYLAVLRLIISGAKEMRERHATLMNNIAKMVEDSIRSGQADGSVRADLDPHDTATILLLTAIASIVWDDIGMNLDLPTIGETLSAMISGKPRRPASRRSTKA